MHNTIELSFEELTFGLVAKTYSLCIEGHGFEIKMREIIYCNDKGMKFEDQAFIFLSKK